MATIGQSLSGFGAADLFRILRDGQPRTRAELASLTGFSRGTVSARVDELLESGLISPIADAISTGGRPSARVALNPQARLVAAADFGATHATVAIMNLVGNILNQQTVERNISSGPRETLNWLTRTIKGLLKSLARPYDDLVAIGIGLPGPVAHATGRPTKPPIMPGWDNYDVPAHLRATFDVPVLVDNDVNVMALGERWQGHPEARDMVFVKVSTGIGSGIISGGTLQRGADGSAGDIGHIPIPSASDVLCRCGNFGCLEAVAGTPALITELTREGLQVGSAAELIAAGRAGDLRATRAMREAGRNIGQVLNMFVSIVNPSLIVVGGALSEANELLIAGMREVVYGRSMPLATQNLAILPSTVGSQAGVIGAGIMAIEFALSSAEVPSSDLDRVALAPWA